MHKIIILGGPSYERFISMASGMNLIAHFDFDLAIFIDEQKACHRVDPQELRTCSIEYKSYPKFTREYLASSFDTIDPGIFHEDSIVFNALHGTYGEDGELQSILDQMGIAYCGSNALACKRGFDKFVAKELVKGQGIHLARTFTIDDLSHLPKIPLIIKPRTEGSSRGIQRFSDADALRTYFKNVPNPNDWLIEEFLTGQEYTCGVLETREGLRGLEPVEIRFTSQIFGYDEKYLAHGSQEICPCDLAQPMKEEIKKAALKIHQTLGCSGYSRSDFVLVDGKFYFLEINPLPGLTPNSLYPKELKAEKVDLKNFVQEQFDLASLQKSQNVITR